MAVNDKKQWAHYFSVPEAARECGVTRNSMYGWVKGGKIKASQTPGKTNRIHPNDLIQLMESNGMHVPPHIYERARLVEEMERRGEGGPSDRDILVVDDDPRNREFIKRTLSTYRILEAETGFEALHILTKNTSVKVILLDLRMPGQHGLQTLKELKRIVPKAAVMVITAYAGDVPTSLLMNGMVAAIIEKPFSPLDLSQTVGAAFV